MLCMYNLKLVSCLILQRIGDGWTTNLDQLRELETIVNDNNFIMAVQTVKQVSCLKSIFIFFVYPSTDQALNTRYLPEFCEQKNPKTKTVPQDTNI